MVTRSEPQSGQAIKSARRKDRSRRYWLSVDGASSTGADPNLLRSFLAVRDKASANPSSRAVSRNRADSRAARPASDALEAPRSVSVGIVDPSLSNLDETPRRSVRAIARPRKVPSFIFPNPNRQDQSGLMSRRTTRLSRGFGGLADSGPGGGFIWSSGAPATDTTNRTATTSFKFPRVSLVCYREGARRATRGLGASAKNPARGLDRVDFGEQRPGARRGSPRSLLDVSPQRLGPGRPSRGAA